MICYFSGTGNTRLVAEALGALLDDAITPITTAPPIIEDVTLGLVFPIYAWGMPEIFAKWLKDVKISAQVSYIYMVCTCGDDIGCTDKTLKKSLHIHHQRSLQAAFSLRMPNTYVSLPGFDVDSEALAEQKLVVAREELKVIAEHIRLRHQIVQVVPGRFPRLKTYLLRPFFNRFLLSDKPFSATPDCITCRTCERVCPVQNITFPSSRPAWGGRCTGCLACYHHCPKHCINYGKRTIGKGQYKAPKTLM